MYLRSIASLSLCLLVCNDVVSSTYIDLTHPINENTLYWFKDKFELTPAFRQTDPHWVATNKFSTAEHGGTHIDAPYHFNPDGWLLGQIPLSRLFMVEGILINKTEEALKDPEYQVTAKDLEDWVKEHGPLPDKCVVLVSFGWSYKYPERAPYLGIRSDNDWDRHFPSLSGDAAQWLVDSGKVYGLGVDTASPDSTQPPHVHKKVLKENMFILENLNLKVLDQEELKIPARGFQLVILPMNIQKGTGGPARVVLVNKKRSGQ